MNPKETIAAFDTFLAEQGLSFQAVIIGGAALSLLGVVSRQTRDCDILHPDIPDAILDVAKAFAEERRREGDDLTDDWLNNGPSSLADVLPPRWRERVQTVFAGRSVTLHSLGRIDLLRSKLFALCDRNFDLPDCIALAPTAGELTEIQPWLEQQDANPDWPTHVQAMLDDLRKRLGHGQ